MCARNLRICNCECNKECGFNEYLPSCTCKKNDSDKSLVTYTQTVPINSIFKIYFKFYCFIEIIVLEIRCLLLLMIIAINCYHNIKHGLKIKTDLHANKIKYLRMN